MRNVASLVVFLALVLGGGLVIGFSTAPGGWYAQLAKPAFNPPSWVFGPAWTLLYVFVAIAGWRIWNADRSGWPMKLWWAQLILNFLWSPIFFGAHQVGLGFAVILALLATIISFVGMSWKQHNLSAVLFLPYAAWVAFAALLNGFILVSN